MRTTVNLEPEAYRLARALAAQRNLSIGKILSEALLSQFKPTSQNKSPLTIDSQGFPRLSVGKIITPEDVAVAIEEG